jgi:hypothetical protein
MSPTHCHDFGRARHCTQERKEKEKHSSSVMLRIIKSIIRFRAKVSGSEKPQ